MARRRPCGPFGSASSGRGVSGPVRRGLRPRCWRWETASRGPGPANAALFNAMKTVVLTLSSPFHSLAVMTILSAVMAR